MPNGFNQHLTLGTFEMVDFSTITVDVRLLPDTPVFLEWQQDGGYIGAIVHLQCTLNQTIDLSHDVFFTLDSHVGLPLPRYLEVVLATPSDARWNPHETILHSST